MHEPHPGQFDFEGDLNVAEFINLAGELGLYVLFRPGPYICSEWDWGGLPFWLLRDPNMVVRSQYHGYTKERTQNMKLLLTKATAGARRAAMIKFSKGRETIHETTYTRSYKSAKFVWRSHYCCPS